MLCKCFLKHLHKVLCCCSGIDLDFSHRSTFISRRQNVSPSWGVWRLRGPMVFILAYYCLYRWMWYLQVFGNCSQGCTSLGAIYFLRSWLISFDFPMMSSKEALSLKVSLEMHGNKREPHTLGAQMQKCNTNSQAGYNHKHCGMTCLYSVKRHRSL